MPSAQHSKATVRWGTPAELADMARLIMGNIDLDPCSEERFNKNIKATQYYSLLERGEDGLQLPWAGKVFCNPPGGLIREFWNRAMAQPIDQMIWIGFSVEQLCILADEEAHPLDFSCCILRRRVSFQRHDDFEGSPAHGNYICGINTDLDKFEECFSSLGRVSHGKYAVDESVTRSQGF